MSRVLFLLCLAYVCGVFVWSIFIEPHHQKISSFASFYAKKVAVAGMVASDPISQGNTVQITVKPDNVEEQVLVNASKFSRFQYGDRVQLSGKLQEPPIFEDFNYKDYLKTKGVGAIMWYPTSTILEQGKYHSFFVWLYANILNWKHGFEGVIERNFSAPYGTILSAFMLGDQNTMTDELKQQLNVTGLRHIIAISGQHIVILTGMLEMFLLSMGFWKKHAILLSALLMVFFIVLTGAQSSAVRSGIMGGFFFLGQYLGRMRVSMRGLVYAATGMLLLNPLLLLHDVGFQLSFLAVFGIIVSFSFFQHVFSIIPSKGGIRDMIAMNFSAQLFTFPILLYNFGYISLIGIVTNLLILPIVSWLLGLGLVFLLLGALWNGFGVLLSYPLFFLLYYFHFVVTFFASLPFASLTIQNLSPFWLISMYIPIACMLWKFKQNKDFVIR